MSPDPLRVLVVDDQPPLRDAFREALKGMPRFKVVGEAGGTAEALAQLHATRPHLAVVDISLGKGDSGMLLVRKIREHHPETRSVIWSISDDDAYIAEAKAAGVRGYVLKSHPTAEIVTAIEEVAKGGCYCSSGVDWISVPRDRLTKREMAVLGKVASAKSSQEIADELGIEISTVQNHRYHIMSKLGATNVVDMVIIAIRLGLLDCMNVTVTMHAQ